MILTHLARARYFVHVGPIRSERGTQPSCQFGLQRSDDLAPDPEFRGGLSFGEPFEIDDLVKLPQFDGQLRQIVVRRQPLAFFAEDVFLMGEKRLSKIRTTLPA